jgi:hypothetical protein
MYFKKANPLVYSHYQDEMLPVYIFVKINEVDYSIWEELNKLGFWRLGGSEKRDRLFRSFLSQKSDLTL